jgi:hypothetical protein
MVTGATTSESSVEKTRFKSRPRVVGVDADADGDGDAAGGGAAMGDNGWGRWRRWRRQAPSH